MPGAALHHLAKERPAKPLVVRAGIGRTFGSLTGFLALLFLSTGVYLLADAFAHPVDAQSADLIVAAFAIALASLLFFYLFNPRRFWGRRSRLIPEDVPPTQDPASSSVTTGGRDARKDLVHQRSYVDRSRIRP